MIGYYYKHITDTFSYKVDLSDWVLGFRAFKHGGYPYYKYKLEFQFLCFAVRYEKR